MVTAKSLPGSNILLFGILLITSLCWSVPVWSALTARLERNPIELGETVRLIIESDQADAANGPDLEALQSLFSVHGTRQSSSISITNGQQTISNRWIIELEPEQVGTYSIPAFTIGTDKSSPLSLTVIPPARQARPDSKDYFVEISADKTRVTVHEQTVFTIKLYLAVNLLEGSLSDIDLPNAELRRLGQDKQYNTAVNGRSFRVIERNVAVLPAQAGTFAIPPILFRGRIGDTGSNSSPGFSHLFSQGKRIRARSNSIQLEVIDPPVAFNGSTWLPAQKLMLADLSAHHDTLRVGEPITRKIGIEAHGLAAEQLPGIQFPESSAYKQYPDQVQRETRSTGVGLVSTAQRSIAIVPNQTGTLTLPEVSLQWWNTGTQTLETATLPPRTFTVEPAAQPRLYAATGPTLPGETGAQPGDVATLQTEAAGVPASPPAPWLWIVLSGVLFMAWLSTLLFLFAERRRASRRPGTDVTRSTGNAGYPAMLRELEQACRNDDAQQAYHLLLKPLAHPDFHHRINAELLLSESAPGTQAAIRGLESFLYESTENSRRWCGDDLLAGVQEAMKQRRRHKIGDAALPHLYPVAG